MITKSLVGERVRRLRVALGLGQSELALQAGMSAGALSMLENGRWPVDESQLSALADVLDCAPGYLMATGADPLATRPWLRAYADAPRRTVDRTVADSVTAVEAAELLGLKMVPDSLPLFDEDPNDEAAIEEFATEVRGVADLGPGDVVRNAIRAAERLGCVVLPIEDELGRHLGLSLRVSGHPVIRASRPSSDPDRTVPGDRQRFTVAHELGHLTLHQGSPPPDSAAEAARLEKQAHRFAAAFLAPGDALLADLEALGGRVTLTTLAQLKETWGVAIKMLVLRFRHLGIIDDDHARSLYKQISARRWNKVEPVVVGNESAIWLSKAMASRWKGSSDAVAAASEGSGLGIAYFARWLDWSPSSSERPCAEVVPIGRVRTPPDGLDGAPATVTPLTRRPR
jgi:Zn-dependent peptidase ImmA (M78 family)/DNA-binding Xre family transcriptional regulator